MQTILVVEDDKKINHVIGEFLKEDSFHVIAVENGEDALECIFNHRIDLCILDIMLPGIDGIEVLKEIRKHTDIPVIMLTALSDEYTQLQSFDFQADEYVTKPFSPLVLVKRVHALLKRVNYIEKEIVIIGHISIDFSACRVMNNEEEIHFTVKELDILKLLIQNKGHVLTRNQILNSVWGLNAVETDRAVDTHIKNIRKKLNINCIITVKGLGYKFEETI